MIRNQFNELVFSQDDVCDLLMQGRSLTDLNRITVDHTVNLELLKSECSEWANFESWQPATADSESVEQFHLRNQQQWHMPDEYKQLDIAEYVLSLCHDQDELQRCGQELLLYQERNLFDLLRYLKYLVDVMQNNNIIWGVGRGSSVASYVLYKLGIHRINSMYYDLDPAEFLR
jgi:DNA polymerase III alpha subunit